MVLAGIDRIDEEDVASKLRGKRLGVISSTSGLSSDLRYPMDVLNEKYNVMALFAPEHGPRGVAGPGEKISGGIDRTTGLPVFRLFIFTCLVLDFFSVHFHPPPILYHAAAPTHTLNFFLVLSECRQESFHCM